MSLPFPLAGTTLVVGPSNTGKTRLTARALDAWVDEHGPAGCVVLDFAPTVERDGKILGGPLTQFTEIPAGVHHAVVDAHAPRADAETDAEALELAEANAAAATDRLDAAPAAPRAVFVNDATIALQRERSLTERLTNYCDRADCAVLNAFESDELGVEDTVSANERAALVSLRAWADRVVELSESRGSTS
jgi:molybdopterin-guanine dinucleotide biosynthesis protein